MKTYKITVYEIWENSYIVKGEDAVQALENYEDMDRCEAIHGASEFVEVDLSHGISEETVTEELPEFKNYKSFHNDEYLEGIASIERIENKF